MKKFWGIEAHADPVVKKAAFDKDFAVSYGIKDQEEGHGSEKSKQTKADVIKVFFAGTMHRFIVAF